MDNRKFKITNGTIALFICVLCILINLFVAISSSEFSNFFLIILTTLFTLFALGLGYSARKDNPSDRNAKRAIRLGWLNIMLTLITIFILLNSIFEGVRGDRP